MNRRVITDELIESVAELVPVMSNSAIAQKLNVSVTTVIKIQKQQGIKRNKEALQRIRSESRSNLIRTERRRALFGLEQHTDIKVFTNRERNVLKNLLKRKGYVFIKRGDVIAYISNNTKRVDKYEERGKNSE